MFIASACMLFSNFSKAQNTVPVNVSALHLGSGTTVQVRCMAKDAAGNLYIAGGFQGTVDFDPSDNVANLTFAGPNLYGDVFLAKYNSKGEYQWAMNAGAVSNTESAMAIALDASSNVYITGNFSGTNIDFNPSPTVANTLTTNGGNDMFLAKYSTDGAYLWAFNMGGSVIGGTESGLGLAVDAGNNVYVTGNIVSTAGAIINFNPLGTANSLSAKGSNDIFLAKYNSAGQNQWAFIVGLAAAEYARGLAMDASDNIYITGEINGTSVVNMNPLGIANNITGHGLTDIFVAKYNSNGICQWASAIGSATNDVGNAIAVDASGNTYVTGSFTGTNVDFDQGAGTANLSAAGNLDVFVAKYNTNGQYQWAFPIGGSSASTNDIGYSITTDANSNVFVSGVYNNAVVDFNPSPTTTANLNQVGGQDAFVAKYNTSGQYQWAYALASSGTDIVYSIIPGLNRTFHIGGCIGAATDLDPSSGSSIRTPLAAFEGFAIKYFDGTIWTGANTANWNTAANWSTTVPDATQPVYVRSGDVTNMPIINTAGNTVKSLVLLPSSTLTVNGGITASDSLVVRGTLTGTGSIIGNVYNAAEGNVAPALSAASTDTLNVTGKYYTKTGGKLSLRISGTAGAGLANGNDLLMVSDSALLSDTLVVSLTDPLLPITGLSFTLLRAGNIGGTFAQVQLPSSVTGNLTYTANSVILNVSSPLPIGLLDFSARKNGSKVDCSWKVSANEDQRNFIVQRSTDGTHFVNAGEIASDGKSNYGFSDDLSGAVPAGIQYYRLQVNAKDGKSAWSKVVPVYFDYNENVVLAPNPAHNYFTLSGTEGSVMIVNMAGKKVYSQTLNKGVTNISTENFPKGHYLVIIHSINKEKITKSLVIE